MFDWSDIQKVALNCAFIGFGALLDILQNQVPILDTEERSVGNAEQ